MVQTDHSGTVQCLLNFHCFTDRYWLCGEAPPVDGGGCSYWMGLQIEQLKVMFLLQWLSCSYAVWPLNGHCVEQSGVSFFASKASPVQVYQFELHNGPRRIRTRMLSGRASPWAAFRPLTSVL